MELDAKRRLVPRGMRRPRTTAVAAALCTTALCLLAFAGPLRAKSPSDAAVDRAPSAPRPGITGFRLAQEVPGLSELGLRRPSAVAVDHRGNILVADTGNHRVLTLTTDGEVVDEFGGFGWEEGQLDSPSDLSVYTGFYTYVLDEGNRRVARFDVDGDYLDLLVTEDEAGSPVSLAVGRVGELLLVDVDSQSVVVYSQFDEALEPLGSFGPDAGGLVDPVAVAVGPSGEVAVADAGRHSVEVFDEFGSPLFSLTAPDTLVPRDVAIDARGNVIVVDEGRDRILAFPGGGGPHTASFSGDGFSPGAIALGPSGELVAVDPDSGRVLLIETVYAETTPERH